MAKPRIAINGLGRIGRLACRLLFDNDQVEIVGINDLADNETLAYLLKYDSSQGKWDKELKADKKNIYINGKAIPCTAEKDPELLPWKKMKVDVVLECTGFFLKKADAEKHITAGARKVIISAPAKDEVKTIVIGVNHKDINANDTVLSNASCTTNCLAPMIKVLDELCGIDNAYMSTIHAYTGNQKLQDSIQRKDLRRGRAAAINIVPTSSGATSTVIKVMPQMEGKLQGGAVRVPVVTGSLTELYANVGKEVSVEEINKAFKKAAGKSLKNILEYTEDPIVSTDIIHNTHSCIFDPALTMVMGKHVKIVGWYDNEYGYANRICDLVMKVV
ncbi:MAG: type I glyceraldehyde-3-phosphate dehydrogenase [Chitinophagales bacterium]